MFTPGVSVGTDEASMLRAGPSVRIALPGSTLPAGRYSRYRCVGDMEDPDKFQRRTCLFENVCYDTTDTGDFPTTSANTYTVGINSQGGSVEYLVCRFDITFGADPAQAAFTNLFNALRVRLVFFKCIQKPYFFLASLRLTYSP